MVTRRATRGRIHTAAAPCVAQQGGASPQQATSSWRPALASAAAALTLSLSAAVLAPVLLNTPPALVRALRATLMAQ